MHSKICLKVRPLNVIKLTISVSTAVTLSSWHLFCLCLYLRVLLFALLGLLLKTNAWLQKKWMNNASKTLHTNICVAWRKQRGKSVTHFFSILKNKDPAWHLYTTNIDFLNVTDIFLFLLDGWKPVWVKNFQHQLSSKRPWGMEFYWQSLVTALLQM